MKISLLVLEFHLEGCRSLKEKRRRLAGMRERFGKQPNIALCESGFHDEHKRSQWSFVAVSVDSRGVNQTVSLIEEDICNIVDAVVVDIQREEL